MVMTIVATMPVKAISSNLSLNRAAEGSSYAERLRRRSQQIPAGGTLPRASFGRKAKVEDSSATLTRASSRTPKMPNMYGCGDSDSETSQSTIKLDRNGNIAVSAEDRYWDNEDSDTLGRGSKLKAPTRPSLRDVQWRHQDGKADTRVSRNSEVRTAPNSRAGSIAQLQNTNGSIDYGSSKEWILTVNPARASSRAGTYNSSTLERTRPNNAYATNDPGDRFASISSRNSLRRRQSSTTRSITSTRSTRSHQLNSRGTPVKGMAPAPTLLSENELMQVGIMYQSHSSQVIVCRCLANLYFSDNDERTNNRRGNRNWELIFTGVPVLLLDMGDSRCRSSRRLHIILAEKGTGFALWRDSIDTFSKYKEIERTFHTMLQSSNHRKLIGFSFDNAFAATEFHSHLKEFLTDPENILLWRDPGAKKKDTKSSKVDRSVSFQHGHAKRQWLKKVQISTPCCFQHITSIRPSDLMNPDQLSSSRDNSALNLRMSITSSRSPSTDTFPKRSTSSAPFISHSIV